MKSSITKYIIGAIFVLVIATYAIWSSRNTSGSSQSIASLIAGISDSSTIPMTSNGNYKNGTYTGSVADAFYGQLQVVATISSGMLIKVAFPVYPNESGHTINDSKNALPILAQEAIAAQSANVQIVSGATQDSNAFQQSLGAALAQAQ